MEVHHHPDIHYHTKMWKEYLLEGFMIFVAVMLGFLAESLRENISDREKEREYISSFIRNLESDTSVLASVIGENEWKGRGLDSLKALAKKNMNDQETRRSFYHLVARYTSYYSAFISYDATMMQLKNSGGLRFIRKQHVADSIATYDLAVRDINYSQVPYGKAINDVMDAAQELLDDNVYEDSTYFKDGYFTGKPLPLLSKDPDRVRVFFNKISYEQGWTNNYVSTLQKWYPFAVRLISYLKKAYGFERETQ
ncbi:MAG TPA: hypothetical protein VKR32_03715 [Puia sp.]|nr:hypothetical protein [Puia sp.]